VACAHAFQRKQKFNCITVVQNTVSCIVFPLAKFSDVAGAVWGPPLLAPNFGCIALLCCRTNEMYIPNKRSPKMRLRIYSAVKALSWS